MGNQRIVWMDIGKGIAIICVVLGHCIVGLDSPLKHAIFTFHMPLFFIFAGITFKQKPFKGLLKTSFKRLIIPFIVLFLIQALFVVLHAEQVSISLIKNIGLSFLFASAVKVKPWGFAAAGMIWFLVVLFISRIIVNLLCFLFEKTKAPLLAQILFICAFAALGITASHFAYLPFSFDLVPLACLFMFSGYFVKKYDALEKALSWPAITIALVIWLVSMKFCWFSMGDRMFDYAPLAIAGSLAGTMLISKISQLIEKGLPLLRTYFAFMGKNSMLVFALHYIESHIVGWSSFALLSSLGNAWYALFAARFALIMLIILCFIHMPIAANKHGTASPAPSEEKQILH